MTGPVSAIVWCLCLVGVAASMSGASPKAAVLDAALPGAAPQVVEALERAVTAAGYECESIDVAALSDPAQLTVDRYQLLVLPHARAVPVASLPAIQQYLESGGTLIACGVPLCGDLVFRSGDRWMTRAEYEQVLAKTSADHSVVRWSDEQLSRWERSTNNDGPIETKETIDIDGGEAEALHVVLSDQQGWDTLERPLESPPPAGHALTIFRAKGGPGTPQLAVEWRERDGSRWIATVDLTTEWKTYVLPVEAFKPWRPPAGRGRGNDRLNLSDVELISVGLAFSHTGFHRGRQEYFIADIGTAAPPPGDAKQWTDLPHLESLCPQYQFFPVTRADAIRSADGNPWVETAIREVPQNLHAMHPRPSGAGFDKGRPWRWQALLEAAEGEEMRGTIAALVVNVEGDLSGSAWVSFTPDHPAFYARPEVGAAVTQAATALRRGVFFIDAGNRFYTQFADQPFELGAQIIRLRGATTENVRMRIGVDGSSFQDNFPVDNRMSKLAPITARIDLPQHRGTVVVEMVDGEQVIDRISHEVHQLHPADKLNFIHCRDGQFWLNGKPWKAHGVNYMPSSGIGLNNQEMFEHWIGAAAYDPVIIQRDLERIKAMGMNAVSVFIYRKSLDAGNLLDLLRRCRELGIYANLSLRPGTPMNFPWQNVKEMIERSRLAENDTVFAYDLAWEPTHYTREHQREHYTALWNEWVKKRHGSIEAAEKAWAFESPREEDGRLAVPLAAHIVTDGEWRKLVAEYRGFLDDLLAERYGEARRLIRTIDRNHAVSFRMQTAGDPTALDPGALQYDFWGLRHAVDIWEPEAYGRIGDWERVKPGRFTADYARLCDPDKPLIWAEVGVSAWDTTSMDVSADRLRFQAEYFRNFYRMMRDSGADGVFFWWYPGGYRVNERSDFGIINPDGTDRPVTQVIREESAAFLAAPEPVEPTVWFAIDRDADARGLYGIYLKLRDEYWRAVERGETPALRWSRRPGDDN